eukprot:1117776-Pelagomonas_calceolata.AAC.4
MAASTACQQFLADRMWSKLRGMASQPALCVPVEMSAQPAPLLIYDMACARGIGEPACTGPFMNDIACAYGNGEPACARLCGQVLAQCVHVEVGSQPHCFECACWPLLRGLLQNDWKQHAWRWFNRSLRMMWKQCAYRWVARNLIFDGGVRCLSCFIRLRSFDSNRGRYWKIC